MEKFFLKKKMKKAMPWLGLAQALSLVLSTQHTGTKIPSWTAPLPNVSLPRAGLKPVQLQGPPVTVYSPHAAGCPQFTWPPMPDPSACIGRYNHAPLLAVAPGIALTLNLYLYLIFSLPFVPLLAVAPGKSPIQP